jgi:hypothetical protein
MIPRPRATCAPAIRNDPKALAPDFAQLSPRFARMVKARGVSNSSTGFGGKIGLAAGLALISGQRVFKNIVSGAARDEPRGTAG